MGFMTQASLERLKQELKDKELQRGQVVIDLDEAREQGDLSENAGYHIAKAKLRELDARIGNLRKMIPDAQIIDVKQVEKVEIGSYVKVHEEISDKTSIFRIVGEEDLDVSESGVTYITYTSVVARALLNKIVNDEIELKLPAGERIYIILEIAAAKIV